MHLNYRLVLLCAALCLAPLLAWGQTPPVSQAEIERIAAQSEFVQRLATRQEPLQDWFLWGVDQYLHQLDGTALGDPKAKMISFGDRNKMLKILCFPSGKGTVAVVFTQPPMGKRLANWWYGRDMSPQKVVSGDIQFPRNAIAHYWNPVGGDLSTNWHELNHALLEPNGVTRVTAIRWWPYLYSSTDTDEHHVYIEGLGARAADWLRQLLLTYKFEDHIRAAAQAEEEFTKRGEPMDYFHERNIWAKCSDDWRHAWPLAEKIAPLPDDARKEYKDATGVTIPTVEDVIRFYMKGGVKRNNKAVHVPEWVMRQGTVNATCGFTIEQHDPDNGLNDDGEHSFQATLIQSYIKKIPVTEGTITFYLPDADPQTTLQVNLGAATKLPAVSKTKVIVDLAAHAADIQHGRPFIVTFKHAKPAAVAGKKTFRVCMLYSGCKDILGPVYTMTQADVFIDITGVPPPPKPQPIPSGLAGVKSAVPGWKLTVNDAANKYQEYEKKVEVKCPFKTQDGKDGVSTIVLTASIHVGQCSVRYNGTQDSVAGALSTPNPNYGRVRTVKACTIGAWKGKTSESAINFNDYMLLFAGRGPSGGDWQFQGQLDDISYSGGGPDSDEGRAQIRARIQQAKDGLAAEMHAALNGLAGVTKPPASSAPVKATVAVRTQLPAAQPEDPALDNEPPKDGELISSVKAPPLPPPPPPPPPPPKTPPAKKASWYTHPSGGYRLQLPTGWGVIEQYPSPDFDCLAAQDNSIVVLCNRGVELLGDNPVKKVMEDYQQRFRRIYPKAEVTTIQCNGTDAVQAAVYEETTHRMLWPIVAVHAGRADNFTVLLAPRSEKQGVPDRVLQLFGTLQYLTPPGQ